MSDYFVVERAGRVVMPPVLNQKRYAWASVWDDSADNLERFARSLGTKTNSSKEVEATAVLVHHSHNTYNPNAISVSRPKSSGGTIAQRHLAYLRDKTLREIGPGNLPDLIKYAGGEVEVTIVVVGHDELMVDFPDPAILAEAIAAFLAERGITASGAPRWGGDGEPTRNTHSGKNTNTVRTLRLLNTHQSSATPVTGIQISTSPAHDPENRSFAISDSDTGRRLGTVFAGVLNLVDERDRDYVLPLLATAGLPVAQPVTDPKDPEDGTWPDDLVPNAWARLRAGALDLRARNPEDPNSQETFAIYNTTSDTLWVEDSTLLAPALRYFHRMGIDPDAIGLPRKAWALDDEVSYRALRDNTKYSAERTPLPVPKLLKAAGALVPKGVLKKDVVAWVKEAPASPLPQATSAFHLFEQHVVARANLFPQHELTGATARCRLCADQAAVFLTPISTNSLAYCHNCLNAASTGLVDDRSRAAAALRRIGELEFDSQPMLEHQLATLHVNPGEPIAPEAIDELLALRFGVARKRMAWTLLLEEAGFAEDGLRTGRGTLIRSRDGHLCHSMREKAVCDFLHQHGIAHDREPHYPHDPDYNATGLRRADWQLTDGTLVELWGLPKDPAYAAKMEAKRALVARHSIRLVELFDTDLPDLPTIFGPWTPEGTRTGWTWSPLLVATAEVTAHPASESKGDNRGRNDYNTATQRERVARCARAVQLQTDGLTRPEIGDQMGTSLESVKELLRDGKFYADPTSDPARHDLAHAAAAARANNKTRAAFRETYKLTKPKAAEAWRDAAVLFDDAQQTEAPN